VADPELDPDSEKPIPDSKIQLALCFLDADPLTANSVVSLFSKTSDIVSFFLDPGSASLPRTGKV